MIKINSKRNDIVSRLSRFSNSCGTEVYLTMEIEKGHSSASDISMLLEKYNSYLSENGMSTDSEVYLRFYLHDIKSDAPVLRRCLEARRVGSFYTMVGQSPLSGGRAALEAYHIESHNPIVKAGLLGEDLHVRHGKYLSLWMKHAAGSTGCSETETSEIFRGMSERLSNNSAFLKDDLVRTWCYIDDIDNNYKGFVDIRREYFASLGMTKDTHTIASTGIGVSHESSGRIVSVDSLAVMGLDRLQVDYMTAPDNMPSTYAYNVSFERGTRIIYGDRSHCYISGTAAIDVMGNVMYTGDIKKQTMRTLDNVRSLLAPYNAGMDDMKMLIVYLREDSAAEQVPDMLDDLIPSSLPRIIVRGNVCRPEWLVEMEGVAILDAGNSKFPPFC